MQYTDEPKVPALVGQRHNIEFVLIRVLWPSLSCQHVGQELGPSD